MKTTPRFPWLLALAAAVLLLAHPSAVIGQILAPASPASAAGDSLPPQVLTNLLTQIGALEAEARALPPAQQKLATALRDAVCEQAGWPPRPAAPLVQSGLPPAPDGIVRVDITATVSDALLARIASLGGTVLSRFPQYDAIRADVPLIALGTLVEEAAVRFVRPAEVPLVNTGSVTSEADVAHQAQFVRTNYSVTGSGVSVGLLSDSVRFLATSQASGDLPAGVTVLAGQSGLGGTPDTGEGTAMLELVQDLAPGAALFFSSGNGGQAAFASNIVALANAGCQVIVDDLTYPSESPFHDNQLVSQAVQTVSDAGVVFFSSAANSGNQSDGTSGTWRGDFLNSGTSDARYGAGQLHNWGGAVVMNPVTQTGNGVGLYWTDPLAGSTNNYNLFVVNAAGSVLRQSTVVQNGSNDPYESVSAVTNGEFIVVTRVTGTGRMLHVDTRRGRLNLNTSGSTRGHNAASADNAFSVAASTARLRTTPFIGGTNSPVETFSSDGLRTLFYEADGTAVTPGNLSSSGGRVLLKPDLAAADGVATSAAFSPASGLNPFYGTSAAAPHAAAIAALLLSYQPTLTAADIRAALEDAALDIEGLGWDRNSGRGLIMADRAIYSLTDTTAPTIAITTPVADETLTDLIQVSGWATDDSGLLRDLTFTLHELDPSGGPGRYWNGLAWQGGVYNLFGEFAGTNWSQWSGLTLPPLNSGISYEITATATDPARNSASATITFHRSMDTLTWDPGLTHLGTEAKPQPHTLGGPFIFKIVTLATTVGGWRSALNVTSDEANLFLSRGSPPTTASYSYASTRIGSDGWVLHSSEFAESEEWFYLVETAPSALWNLVSGEPYVLDLGELPDPAASGVTNVTVGAEGYRFFRTTTPANPLAWQLWLGGAANSIQVQKSFIPLTGYLEREQAKAMLLVPDYLAGSVTYFVGVPGAPGEPLSFTSKEQPVTDIAFSSTQSSVVVAGFPYRTYRVAVPINQIAWEVASTPVAGDANVAARRGKVPNEFNSSAFSDVAGAVEDSFTMVPPSLSDGTFYITVYGGAAHTFTLRNGEPIITPRVFIGTTTNNLTARAGWRFYVLTNIAEQIGTLGWELDLANHVPGTEIALRRNAVPGRWFHRDEGYTSGEGYVDYSGTAGFLQRPGHQADIWYIGIYQPATSLGAFRLTTRAIPAPPVAFDNGSATVANLAEGRWTYLRVDVPADMFGWDARLTNVTAGSPRLTFRRDLLPESFAGWSYATEWPSGAQNAPGLDWTGLGYSTSGEDENGRIFAVGRDNMLQTGTYYVGIYSSSGAASFKFISRGIGTNYAIGITNLAFSGTGSKATNIVGLPPREAAYYRVVVPSNAPNWLVRLTPTTGEALLDIQKNVLPNIAAGAYGNVHDSYGKSLRKLGREHYLLLPTEGNGALDAETNYLAVVSEGVGPDYSAGSIGSNTTTYVLESLGSLAVNPLGAGALPAYPGAPLTQSVALEGGQVTLWKFTVPPGVAAMEVRLLNRVGSPLISLLPGTNAPYPHRSDNYGADGGWSTGRRDGTELLTIANPAASTWTVTLKAESAGGLYPDAACDVQIRALAPANLAFNSGSVAVTGHEPGTWKYYTVSVPAGADGWDLRLTNVTAGTPLLRIRRDLLPDETSAPGIYWEWPSGAQLNPVGDWTGRYLNPDESSNDGRLAMMARDNVLTNGTYYVGVFNENSATPADAAYTLVSRGVGTGYAIPVTSLNFSGAGSAHTNLAGLPAREAAYYRIVVPSNAPSWHIRATPTAGGELLLIWNPQVLPNSHGNPNGRQMQKPGKELFTWFSSEGEVFLPPGTNCFAVVSEGVAPPDTSHVGTGNVTYRIESLGPVPLLNLGVLPLAGPPITRHVSLEGAEVKLFRFNTTTLIPSVELRLTNRVANPIVALRPGTNAPMPYSSSSYYGIAGGYYSERLENPELITLANVASGIYTFTVFAPDDGSGAFPDAEADLSLTPRPPTDLAYLTGNEAVSDQLPSTWRFFKVTVPADTEGWELRLTGSGSGLAQMAVRRGALPEPSASGANIHDTTWPDGGQISASSDWTGLNENDGTSAYGHYLGFGRGNPLEPGLYYVGVLNTSTTDPVSYTLASRGIGGVGGIAITTLAFAGGTVSPAPLPARDLAYYKVEVPADRPNWRVRLDTSAGGESRLVIHKDHVPNTGNAASSYPISSTGKVLAKAGNEHYVLFPDEGQSSIAAGTYYLVVASEGVNPALPNIGTGDSAFTLESHGVLPVTELGLVPAVGGMISNHVTLEGGETKTFHFQVAGGVDWVEVRLANRLGNPALAERPGAEIPSPNVPAYYGSYGADGGWFSGRKVSYTLLTLVRPPPTNTFTVKGESVGSEYPDAEADLEIRQRLPSSLTFSNGLVTGSLADNERVFYEVTVPTNQIGWRLQLTATNGTPTVRARKDLLPSDDEPSMAFGGPSIIIAPPFLEAGTWYVEVKGGGATEFQLTSNPVLTQRPAWAMPAFGASVTTPGLPPAGSLFADTGVGTNGLPLPDDQGVDLGVGDFHFYTFTVPNGNVGLLRAELNAISGNPDLYVRRGGVPTFDHPDFGYYGASLVDYQLTGTGTEYGNWVPGNGRTETQLGTGTWYVSVRASASNVRYRLKLSVGTMTPLTSGSTLGGQVLAGNDWRYYRIMVPSNAPQSLTLTWSQQQGDAELRLRDTIPPGEPLDYGYRDWSRDTKNGGPYPSFPDPGTYTLTVPTVRPNTPLYLGFRAAGGDASFTVGVNFSAQNLDITNVVAFYGGVKTVTVPAFGTARFRVPVPADATSWRHSNTHSGAIQLQLDQGTLPDVWGTGYRIWDSGGASDSQLVQYLYGWPWVANQHYFFIATNTAGTPQSLTIRMDGRNAATDDTDGDGLPDGWEILYFGDLDENGVGDPDGDLVNNATELAEGTNPASAASFRPRLIVTTVGLGNVVIAPSLPSYALGQLVTLTAVPDAGQFFNSWSGSASGAVNPLSLTMNGHKTLTAHFSGAATPLVFTNAAINGANHFTATITGPAGAALVVLGSVDLSTWSPIVTNAPFSGLFDFTDPAAATQNQRSYRARLTP